ncbi:MAG TPA: FHA domain-containing protein, partial [Polyangiales bacterium]|nr:FHA domain-containing protein [Polyangiales bacterium]
MDTQTQSTVTYARADAGLLAGMARNEAAAIRLILVVAHEGEVQVVPLPPSGEVVVGRGEGADLRIADQGLSRLHARFQCVGGSVTVTDLGSRNGTFVQRQAVQQALLAVGDFALLG